MSVELPIKVLLAEDHTLMLQALSEMLQRDEELEVVGEAEDGAEAVSLAFETTPDVVLLDVEMPVMGADEAIDRIAEVSPVSRVVILTMYDDPGLMRDFLTRGASGYLLKTISPEALISTVKSQVRCGDRVMLSISHQSFEDADEDPRPQLTERELEILLLVARGMSNAQISSYLRLTEGTVKRHLHNVYGRLGVASRAEATRKALSEGWISSRDITRPESL